MDTRKDKGDYYPGGGREGVTPERPNNGKVDCVNLGEIGESYTLKAVKDKLNEVVRAMAPAAVSLMVAVFGAVIIGVAGLSARNCRAATAPLEDIPNTTHVVTNEEDAVAMAAIGTLEAAVERDKADKTNTYTKSETDAKIVELSPAPGNYGAVSNAAMSAAAQTNDFLRLSGGTMTGSITVGGDGAYVRLSNPANSLTPGFEVVGAYSHLKVFPSYLERLNEAGNTYYFTFPKSSGLLATTSDIEEAVRGIVIPAPDLSEYAKLYTVEAVSNKVEETSAIVNTWETYWGGTNVVMEVTNYYGNTTGTLPRLRIRERRDGVWTNVWDEVDKFNVCKAEILGDVATSNRAVLAVAETNFAPIAWGRVTDKGTPNHATNAVWMTSPETYFAGGTEYQRVAVGSGAICVLVDKGALAHTTGEPGTFHFQDDGGTNYFGFSKSDSYTIGCRTDGITVGTGSLVTLRYDVIMSGTDVPVVYWAQSLGQTTQWTQLNNVDGTAASGAPYTVTWLQDGGSYYANINCGGSPSGFFRAETSVAGDVVWETNMRARLGGGIECTNTATHVNGVIRPSYNGSSVTWTWSAR